MDDENSITSAAMNESPEYIRWYDRQPKLSLACKLLFNFPDEVKSLISEAVLIIVDREFKPNKKPEQVLTLGGDKILGLHKSKNRRREYDINSHLHQAMNNIYMLSEVDRGFIADHILSMVQYIQRYLQTQQPVKTPTSLEEVPSITCLYLQSGDPGVRIFLQQLRLEFCQKLKNGGKLAVANSGFEIIEHDTRTNGADMKVRHTDKPL